MVNQNDSFLNRLWFKKTEKIISIAANIVVISGVMFAFYQVIQTNQLEKRRIAIEAIGSTRSSDFIKAFNKVLTEPVSSDNLEYVVSVYDAIAISYIKGLADECVIKENLYSNVQKLSNIINKGHISEEYGKNVDAFLNLMQNKTCR